MTNKHLKRCSTFYTTIEEMQIKISRCHYIPIEWLQTGAIITPNAGEDLGQQEFLFIADEKAKWYSLTERKFGSFLHN